MKLFKNFSLYSLGKMLVEGLKFFLIPIYTTYIPIAEYGLYSILMTLKDVFLSFSTQIAKASYSRFFFKDKEDKTSLPSIISLFTIGFGFFAILALLLSNIVRDTIFSSFPEYFFLFYVIIAIAFFQFFIQLKKTEVMMRARASHYLIISILIGIFPLLIILYLVLVKDMTIDALLYGLLVPYTIVGTYVLITLSKSIFKRPSKALIRKYFSYGFPMALKSISNKLIKGGDRIIIQIMLSSAAVGAYSFVYLVTNALSLFMIQPFNKVITPIIMKNEDNHKVLQRTVSHASISLLVALSTLAMIFVFFVEYILRLIVTNPEYLDYMPIIYLLSIAFVIKSGNSFASKGLMLSNRTDIIMWITIVTGISNVLMNILFIFFFGIWGAVLASIITYLIITLSYTYYSEKHHFLRYPKARIWTVISTYSLIIGLFYATESIINDILLKVLLIGLYLTILWMLRILTKKNIEYVMKTIRKA